MQTTMVPTVTTFLAAFPVRRDALTGGTAHPSGKSRAQRRRERAQEREAAYRPPVQSAGKVRNARAAAATNAAREAAKRANKQAQENNEMPQDNEWLAARRAQIKLAVVQQKNGGGKSYAAQIGTRYYEVAWDREAAVWVVTFGERNLGEFKGRNEAFTALNAAAKAARAPQVRA